MTVGKHLVVALENVKNIDALKYLENVKPLLKEICDICKLNIVNSIGHQFEPQGCTQIFVLSESHISLHSYPEKEAAYLDIFCCDMNFDQELAIREIKRLFQTDTASYMCLLR